MRTWHSTNWQKFKNFQIKTNVIIKSIVFLYEREKLRILNTLLQFRLRFLSRCWLFGIKKDGWSLLTTFAGNLCPGRYLTFSCVSLMISVSFLPSIISSNTYIVTRSSYCGKFLAFTPTILAMAEPLWKRKN